jgi:uncharacterized protein (TIGR02996 family)
MTDDAAFLSAILDRPDDDLPRLVYADYLDERGDADRAEFIRVQCELAALPYGDRQRPSLEARESELLAANRARWVVPGVRGSQQFRRGFVEVYGASPDELIAAADRLFAVAPIRELRIVVLGHRAEELARIPWLDRIVSLDLSNNITFAPVHHLLTAATFPRLRKLVLRNVPIWADGFTSLGQTSVAHHLESLDLSGCPFPETGVPEDERILRALAGSAGFVNLSTLIAASDGLPAHNCMKIDGVTAIAESPFLNRLRVLDVSHHAIGDVGIGILVRSRNAATWEVLDISHNEIGLHSETGIEAIAESPHLGRLRLLRLGGVRSRTDRCNRIDGRAAHLLVNWFRLADGVTVDLRGCEMSDAAGEVLTASRWADRFLLDMGNGTA